MAFFMFAGKGFCLKSLSCSPTVYMNFPCVKQDPSYNSVRAQAKSKNWTSKLMKNVESETMVERQKVGG